MSTQETDLEEQRILHQNLQLRQSLIQQIVPDGKIPNEDDRDFLIKLLDGSDRVILTKAKIKSDEKQAAKQQQSAAMIANLLNNISFKDKTEKRSEPVTLPETIQVSNKVIGEDSTKIETFEYDQIVNN